MTQSLVSPSPGWYDEPAGVAPRGTLVLLTGRGESAAAYARLGRRLAADAYRVRILEVGAAADSVDPDDSARTSVLELLEDPDLPSPRVLVGSDSGASLAAGLLDSLPAGTVDAAVLAGLLTSSSASPAADQDASWEAELETRTACPAHRRVLSEDPGFARGELTDGTAAHWDGPATALRVPVLVLHGSQDQVTRPQDVLALFAGASQAEVHVVEGGRHDVLNDVTHRSVAATIVLFLERLRLGPDLPTIVWPAY